jgi:sarcosine oxidase subunit delta
MLLIYCPYCKLDRPEIEFRYAGEVHLARSRDPSNQDDKAWTRYLFMRSNRKGPQTERWEHTHGCARHFTAIRDTVSDRFLGFQKAGEIMPPDFKE